MDLSIIVVNYNVRYFLQICLRSLHAATENLDAEIIVVDNASSDGSTDMIRSQFPDIRLIVNTGNAGFGRACNQGLEIAQGEYVLFVNPDTLMGESLLHRALAVFQEDEKIGAVGVCLLDGTGRVLRESKRSIPTFWSAFTKFSGLSDVFPGSPFFNGYYAPELGYDEKGDIEVLPGAFMLIRKKILDLLQGFDPRFFMYAEDIDLSYRIRRAGYRIRYDGSLHVVHFKGESTQKSLRFYTSTFFYSMRLFIQKYKGELYAPAVAWLLQVVVRSIQFVHMVRKRYLPGQQKTREPSENNHVALLSGNPRLYDQVSAYFSSAQVERITASGHGEQSFYLRYTPSFVRHHPGTVYVLDCVGLTFEQILDFWKIPGSRQVYLADSDHAFIISSHNKEKQGEVHTFATWQIKTKSEI